jgi:hypothetical protein
MAVDAGGDTRKGSVKGRSPPMTRKKRSRPTGGSVCDTLRTEIAVLETEIMTTEQALCAAQHEACNERNRLLLDLLAIEQRLLKNKSKQLTVAFQKGDTARDNAILSFDQAVLIAQQLSGRSAGNTQG